MKAETGGAGEVEPGVKAEMGEAEACPTATDAAVKVKRDAMMMKTTEVLRSVAGSVTKKT